jgi:hypothetical protein
MSGAIAKEANRQTGSDGGQAPSRDQAQWAMRRRRTQSRPTHYGSGVQQVRRMKKGDDDASCVAASRLPLRLQLLGTGS